MAQTRKKSEIRRPKVVLGTHSRVPTGLEGVRSSIRQLRTCLRFSVFGLRISGFGFRVFLHSALHFENPSCEHRCAPECKPAQQKSKPKATSIRRVAVPGWCSWLRSLGG